jgi:hypothetical protein
VLLGAAPSLAYELGIFDGATVSELQLNARYGRAARLLYIYVTQMADEAPTRAREAIAIGVDCIFIEAFLTTPPWKDSVATSTFPC